MLKRPLLPLAATLLVVLLPTAARPDEPRTAPAGDEPRAVAAAEEPRTAGSAPPAAAASSTDPATQDQVKALAEELRRLKLEIGIPDAEYRSFAGMGPAASKVYFVPKGLSIGGYGEITYRNNLDDAPNDTSDLLRAVLYLGYRFNERILFNSEIEYEHGGHEVAVEFAYLDFLLTPAARIRVGNLLVPMGFVNEMHEPAFFNGVNRPDVERNIIPTTWNENGVGLHGELGGLRYKLYALNGLDLFASEDEPLQPGSWLRRARTGGAEAAAETFAGVLALGYDFGPATVAAAAYRGRAGQDRTAPTGERIRADVTILEAHAGVTWRGFQARVLGVQGRLGDADLASAALELPPEQSLASRVRGGYAELGYDVLARGGGESALIPFVRYERLDLQDQVPAGAIADPALRYDLVTTGLTYKPIATVVLKADWQWRKTDATSGAVSRALNVGAGFVF
ncbi:MAG TPA: hypothetical protein VFK85_15795 [Anaeromyxobacteraceae bacterium]|nr:hypothetical protein [Anaeromyxobacteraceae bacterium]